MRCLYCVRQHSKQINALFSNKYILYMNKYLIHSLHIYTMNTTITDFPTYLSDTLISHFCACAHAHSMGIINIYIFLS